MSGLGSSRPSQFFAIESLEDANVFLRNNLLRSRLLDTLCTIKEQISQPSEVRLVQLMSGKTDALKVVSSVTLWLSITEDHELKNVCISILEIVESQGFTPCKYTLDWLETQ